MDVCRLLNIFWIWIVFFITYGVTSQVDRRIKRRAVECPQNPNKDFLYYEATLQKCCPCSDCDFSSSFPPFVVECSTEYAPKPGDSHTGKSPPICRSPDSKCFSMEEARRRAFVADGLITRHSSVTFEKTTTTTTFPKTVAPTVPSTTPVFSDNNLPADPDVAGLSWVHVVVIAVIFILAAVLIVTILAFWCKKRGHKMLIKILSRPKEANVFVEAEPAESNRTDPSVPPATEQKRPVENNEEVSAGSEDTETSELKPNAKDKMQSISRSYVEPPSSFDKAQPFFTGRCTGTPRPPGYPGPDNYPPHPPASSEPSQPSLNNSVSMGDAKITGSVNIYINSPVTAHYGSSQARPHLVPPQAPLPQRADTCPSDPVPPSFHHSDFRQDCSSSHLDVLPSARVENTPTRATHIMQNNVDEARRRQASTPTTSTPSLYTLRETEALHPRHSDTTELDPNRFVPQERDNARYGASRNSNRSNSNAYDGWDNSEGLKLPVSRSRHDNSSSTSESMPLRHLSRVDAPVQETGTDEDEDEGSWSNDSGLCRPPNDDYFPGRME